MFRLLRRLRARIKYRHYERDLARELEAHRAMTEADLQSHGLSAAVARPAAARRLGNVTLAREDARAVWIARWVDDAVQDLRYATRQLRHQPSFAVTSVLTVGIALGLLTSVFAVFSGLFLRPWEVPQSRNVFLVTGTVTTDGGVTRDRSDFPLAGFDNLHGWVTSADLVLRQEVSYLIELGPEGETATVYGDYVSDDFIETLRLPLQLGTGFANANGAPLVVLTDAFWKSSFGGRPDIIGRSITLSKRTGLIVGVLAAGFSGLAPRTTDVFVNHSASGVWWPDWASRPDACCVEIVGRVRPGFSRAEAAAELAALGPAALSNERMTVTRATASGTTVAERPNHLRSQVPFVFGLLFVATTLILALACANIGNLHLARGVRRQRELAIRLSLGAGRARIVRQLLSESLVLTALSAAAGLAIATLLPAFVLSFDGRGSLLALRPDFRTYAFVLVAAAAACALFAVAPALRFSRTARLVVGGAPTGAGWLRSLILGVQVATSVTFVTVAALLVRGVVTTAWFSDGGFALREVEVASIIKPPQTYDAPRNAALLTHVTRELKEYSSLAFGITEHPPLYNRWRRVDLPGYGSAFLMTMTSSSFDVLGVPIIAGRLFSDDPGRHEVIVNQALAASVWPGRSALGQRAGNDIVVGVAGNARLANVTLDSPLMFGPLNAPQALFVTFRSNPMAAEVVRQTLKSFDPRLTLHVAPLASRIMEDIDVSVVGASVAGGMALVALLLANVGVFGVAAFIVEERRHEIAVRVALGAARADVRMAVAGAARWPLLGGTLAGLGLTLLGGFLLRSFLLDISPLDPLSYAVAAMCILGAGALATWLPLRRALRVDPAITLRAE